MNTSMGIIKSKQILIIPTTHTHKEMITNCNVSNQHAVHLKFIQSYMSNIFQLKNNIVVSSWERDELEKEGIPNASTGSPIFCISKKDMKQTC